MKLIVGLGNPRAEYEKTRHNLGFLIIDALCKKIKIQLTDEKFNGIFFKNQDFIIAKPLTYMNKSGDFVQAIANYYDIKPVDILVVHDDIDLPMGKVVIKQNGSSGGHNGIKDIINKLGTTEFKRIKVGIGRSSDVINYVLSEFSKADLENLKKLFDKLSDAIVTYIYNDIKYLLDKFSGKW
ncbi:aminoacyl-tRNA hydrolase [Metamycoplasma hyosynoviae]|uniref:aminoacyl-tRNA hydrolase n=1 Tax=Metamycoplasma hyosynoviae TaxID=29559 RepID=UPI00236318F5|nr:aminoacyl-tRNA hydrolase [Metamycoplasma hyosynoviae]MDD1365937.1 aminoacyl-tRNA hydrolase [Metamycoplasma hyosynoviae]